MTNALQWVSSGVADGDRHCFNRLIKLKNVFILIIISSPRFVFVCLTNKYPIQMLIIMKKAGSYLETNFSLE